MNVSQMIARAEELAQKYNDRGYVSDQVRDESKSSGLFRYVILQGQYAFKVTYRTNDAPCNRAEFDFYCQTTDEIREMLAKPHYISRNGNVIVMERLNVSGDVKDYDERDRWKDEATSNAGPLREMISEAHAGLLLEDLHGGNWGRTDGGDWKCIDYGHIAYAAEDRNGDGKYCKTYLANRYTNPLT